MRCDVLDARMNVDMLRTGGREQTVQGGVRTAAFEQRRDVGAAETRPERDVVTVVAAVRLLADVDLRDVEALRGFLLHAVVAHAGAGPDVDGTDGVREVLDVRRTDELLDQCALTVAAGAHDDARMTHALRSVLAPLMHDIDRLGLAYRRRC